MSASDFHVYNCCLPKSLFTWGDCKEFILGPPVAVDSASPPFEAPSMNWEKKLFFLHMFVWQKKHPVIHAPFLFLWWSFCWFWSTCRASLCFWSSWERKAIPSETGGLNYRYQTHLTSRSYFSSIEKSKICCQAASAVLFHLLGLNVLLLCQACLLLFSSSKIVELWWFKCTAISNETVRRLD